MICIHKHFVEIHATFCYNEITKALLNTNLEDKYMSIGSTIKRLRRERDITQEQLAEYLGITSRAVSQWECDRTAPDISQLPALCHIFDVSADVLLGIDIEKSNEMIQSYLDEAKNVTNQGKFEQGTAILREAHRKFPKSYQIMQRLANSLVNVYSRKGEKDYSEVFTLCNRILSECTDSALRYEAVNTLGEAYHYAGKNDELRELAKEMPKSHLAYEPFMVYHWNGDADFKERQGFMAYLIYHTVDMIGTLPYHRHDNGEFIYSLDDRIALLKLQIDLLKRIFPDEDYQMSAQLGEIACGRLVGVYLNKGDLESAWYWLEQGADFAICMDTYDFEAPHTSPVLCGFADGGWIMEDNGNRSHNLLEWLEADEKIELLRSDHRYEYLVNRLKAVAKKP